MLQIMDHSSPIDTYELENMSGSPARSSELRSRLLHENEKEQESPQEVESDERDSSVEDESIVDNHSFYTAAEEQAIIRKFDLRLVLFIAFLYMLSFLDRSST